MIKGAIMVPHPPLIIPEVGRGQENIISNTSEAYEKAARFVAELQPETIVVSSPHSVMYSNYFHVSPGTHAAGDFSLYHAPQAGAESDYDTEMVNLICRYAAEKQFPAGCEGELDPSLDHGTMIPLYFINKYFHDYKLVRIGLSGLSFKDHYKLGKMVQKAANELGRNVVFVGSGDLSHKLQKYGPYGFAKEGPEYDQRIMEVMGTAQFERLFDFDEDFCRRAAECGHRSFIMMAGALDGLDIVPQMLSHQDVTGVGYGICIYRVRDSAD